VAMTENKTIQWYGFRQKVIMGVYNRNIRMSFAGSIDTI
jgi:hypothetical protein